jgi:hypothetical protein
MIHSSRKVLSKDVTHLRFLEVITKLRYREHAYGRDGNFQPIRWALDEGRQDAQLKYVQ